MNSDYVTKDALAKALRVVAGMTTWRETREAAGLLAAALEAPAAQPETHPRGVVCCDIVGCERPAIYLGEVDTREEHGPARRVSHLESPAPETSPSPCRCGAKAEVSVSGQRICCSRGAHDGPWQEVYGPDPARVLAAWNVLVAADPVKNLCGCGGPGCTAPRKNAHDPVEEK